MSDDSDLLSDDVKTVAESFLIAGVHPNLRLVAEAAIRADALKREFIEAMLRSLTLESQNQALQEENDRLGKMLAELNDAQVVQEKALLAIRDSKHAVPPVDASECRAIASNALSPTQETDPE